MDLRRGASLLALLCFLSGRTSSGFSLDVCSSCHVNATCDNKPNGSGKECNCRLGFVGNGLTVCQDKDECQIGGRMICGPHTTCHNTFGSYYCTCLEGYSPSNNMNVFIPNDGTRCQDIDECRVSGLCGRGALCRNLEGSFECSCQLGFTVFHGREPFHPQRDSSTCREVSCGPPVMPYDATLWSATGTTYGHVVTLVCEEGFLWRGGVNTSTCGADGQWTKPSIICEEILCGAPPALPHAAPACCASFTPGSSATYRCEPGFYSEGGDDVALCQADGSWTEPSISCAEVKCGPPPEVPHSLQLWDQTSTVGSQVLYRCASGYEGAGGQHVSRCSARGVWEPLSLRCQEIDCQQPPHKANSRRQWDGTSRLNSEVLYLCEEGFVTRGQRNSSRCGADGTWEEIDLVCEEIQPAINHLSLAGEKCLHWRAERRGGDPEIYKVTYFGSRDFDLTFRDTGKQFLRSSSSRVEVCLDLLPATNYTVHISALSAKLSVSITTNTSLAVPPPPTVYYKEFDTPVPTLSLCRSPNSLDSISVYQVFVLPVDGVTVFNCSSPESPDSSQTGYITAVIPVSRVQAEANFTVGDGLWYGGFLNSPLESGHSYYVLLRVVSRWKTAMRSSCVLWAKVKGSSYVLKVALLCAAASVVLVSLMALGGYSYLW